MPSVRTDQALVSRASLDGGDHGYVTHPWLPLTWINATHLPRYRPGRSWNACSVNDTARPSEKPETSAHSSRLGDQPFRKPPRTVT